MCPNSLSKFTKSWPQVAVGMPVYNGAAFIEAAIENVLKQTHRSLVLVIADNASTDATPSICQAAAKRDPRVLYHRNARNIGALANFNRVYELAPSTPYFVWAAYDDVRSPDFIEAALAALDADPGAVLAYGACRMIDENSRLLAYDDAVQAYRTADGTLVHDDRLLERDLDEAPVARFKAVLGSNGVNAPIHGVFRRSALARTSLHTPHGSDNLLLAEAALLGRFRFVPSMQFLYRIHAASTLHLDRTAWTQRETGEKTARARLPVQTLRNYLRATRTAPGLTIDQRRRARRAVLRYALRGTALRRLVVPGIDNYFGLKRWPWTSATQHAETAS
ncbi:MAG: glycosyltransferase family 2 protein [Bacteroidota bacterium]